MATARAPSSAARQPAARPARSLTVTLPPVAGRAAQSRWHCREPAARPSRQPCCSRVQWWPQAWVPDECAAAARGLGAAWKPSRLGVCSCWAMLTLPPLSRAGAEWTPPNDAGVWVDGGVCAAPHCSLCCLLSLVGSCQPRMWALFCCSPQQSSGQQPKEMGAGVGIHSCRQMDVTWRLQCLHGCLWDSAGLAASQWRAAWCRARAQCQWQAVGQQGRVPTLPGKGCLEGVCSWLRPWLHPHAVNKQPGPSMVAVEDSRAKASITSCMLQLCILCQPCVLSRNNGHRDQWGPPCHVASVTCPHQVQLARSTSKQSYGMEEMLGTMVVPPPWQIGAYSFGSCRVSPPLHARARRSQPCSFAFQRSLAPAHLSTQASPCWASAPTNARPMPTAPGSRSVAGMAVARSPV